ncbi:protein kinase, partial [Candidatus Peregrinibacteria bacterium]|nr:protein kinase [Candidatus Peregrinibacteria bacterium]
GHAGMARLRDNADSRLNREIAIDKQKSTSKRLQDEILTTFEISKDSHSPIQKMLADVMALSPEKKTQKYQEALQKATRGGETSGESLVLITQAIKEGHFSAEEIATLIDKGAIVPEGRISGIIYSRALSDNKFVDVILNSDVKLNSHQKEQLLQRLVGDRKLDQIDKAKFIEKIIDVNQIDDFRAFEEFCLQHGLRSDVAKNIAPKLLEAINSGKFKPNTKFEDRIISYSTTNPEYLRVISKFKQEATIHQQETWLLQLRKNDELRSEVLAPLIENKLNFKDIMVLKHTLQFPEINPEMMASIISKTDLKNHEMLGVILDHKLGAEQIAPLVLQGKIPLNGRRAEVLLANRTTAKVLFKQIRGKDLYDLDPNFFGKHEGDDATQLKQFREKESEFKHRVQEKVSRIYDSEFLVKAIRENKAGIKELLDNPKQLEASGDQEAITLLRLKKRSPEDFEILKANFSEMPTDVIDGLIMGNKMEMKDVSGKTVMVYEGRFISKGGFGAVSRVGYVTKGSTKMEIGVIKKRHEEYSGESYEQLDPNTKRMLKNEMTTAMLIRANSEYYSEFNTPKVINDEFVILETGRNVMTLREAMTTSTPSDAMRAVLTVAKGIEKLQKTGYIHGDLKPDNIIIYQDFETGETKIQIIDNAFQEKSHFDRGGITPGYAAISSSYMDLGKHIMENVPARYQARDNFSISVIMEDVITALGNKLPDQAKKELKILVEELSPFSEHDAYRQYTEKAKDQAYAPYDGPVQKFDQSEVNKIGEFITRLETLISDTSLIPDRYQIQRSSGEKAADPNATTMSPDFEAPTVPIDYAGAATRKGVTAKATEATAKPGRQQSPVEIAVTAADRPARSIKPEDLPKRGLQPEETLPLGLNITNAKSVPKARAAIADIYRAQVSDSPPKNIPADSDGWIDVDGRIKYSKKGIDKKLEEIQPGAKSEIAPDGSLLILTAGGERLTLKQFESSLRKSGSENYKELLGYLAEVKNHEVHHRILEMMRNKEVKINKLKSGLEYDQKVKFEDEVVDIVKGNEELKKIIGDTVSFKDAQELICEIQDGSGKHKISDATQKYLDYKLAKLFKAAGIEYSKGAIRRIDTKLLVDNPRDAFARAEAVARSEAGFDAASSELEMAGQAAYEARAGIEVLSGLVRNTYKEYSRFASNPKYSEGLKAYQDALKNGNQESASRIHQEMLESGVSENALKYITARTNLDSVKQQYRANTIEMVKQYFLENPAMNREQMEAVLKEQNGKFGYDMHLEKDGRFPESVVRMQDGTQVFLSAAGTFMLKQPRKSLDIPTEQIPKGKEYNDWYNDVLRKDYELTQGKFTGRKTIMDALQAKTVNFENVKLFVTQIKKLKNAGKIDQAGIQKVTELYLKGDLSHKEAMETTRVFSAEKMTPELRGVFVKHLEFFTGIGRNFDAIGRLQRGEISSQALDVLAVARQETLRGSDIEGILSSPPEKISLLHANLDKPLMSPDFIKRVLTQNPETLPALGGEEIIAYPIKQLGAGGIGTFTKIAFYSPPSMELTIGGIKKAHEGNEIAGLYFAREYNAAKTLSGKPEVFEKAIVKPLKLGEDGTFIIYETLESPHSSGEMKHQNLEGMLDSPEVNAYKYYNTLAETGGHLEILKSEGQVHLDYKLENAGEHYNDRSGETTGKLMDPGSMAKHEELTQLPSQDWGAIQDGNHYLYVGEGPAGVGITASHWSHEIYQGVKEGKIGAWKLDAYAYGQAIHQSLTGKTLVSSAVVRNADGTTRPYKGEELGNGEKLEAGPLYMSEEGTSPRRLESPPFGRQANDKMMDIAKRLMDPNDTTMTCGKAKEAIREILEFRIGPLES